MENKPGSGSFSNSSPDDAGTSLLAGIIGLAVGDVSRLFALGLDSTLSVSLLICCVTPAALPPLPLPPPLDGPAPELLPPDGPTPEALHAFIGPPMPTPLWLRSLPEM